MAYDDEEAPKTVKEAEERIIEALLYEILDEDDGIFTERPMSNYIEWNEAGQKRFKKAAKNLTKKLKELNINKGPQKIVVKKEIDSNPKVKRIINYPTIRDYMRTYVGE